ncbi:MAG: hypothetical protein P8181_06440, partial [bacterium]
MRGSTPQKAAARCSMNPWWAAVIVAVVSIVVYGNTLGHGFVWDDVSLIVKNPAVRALDAAAVKAVFTQGYARVEGRGEAYYRPLVSISYRVDYRLYNGSPRGFHASNVLFN